MGIYTDEDEHLNKRFFTQVFNQSDNKYQLKLFNLKENSHCEYEYKEIPVMSYDDIFDVKIGEENNSHILHSIQWNKISKIDLNAPEKQEDIITLNENVGLKALKICSDKNKIDSNQLALGISNVLYLVDLNSNKVINRVSNAHYNGILACEFHPFKSFLLATSGMDYSVKFWDIRNLSSPVAGISNNAHWIWDMKYNRKFSRVMITASSSSIVRGIVFDKEKEESDSNDSHLMHENYSHSLIDYVEFDDSVYSLDWSLNDPWIFAAVSCNSYLYINSIPEDTKYQVMLDN